MPDGLPLVNMQVHDYLDHAFGAARLQKISEALARPALHTCLRVNTLRTTPQVLLPICNTIACHTRQDAHAELPLQRYRQPQVRLVVAEFAAGPQYRICWRGMQSAAGSLHVLLPSAPLLLENLFTGSKR